MKKIRKFLNWLNSLDDVSQLDDAKQAMIISELNDSLKKDIAEMDKQMADMNRQISELSKSIDDLKESLKSHITCGYHSDPFGPRAC